MARNSETRLIETIRVKGGRAPLLYLHIRRLVASCRALGVPFPPSFSTPEGGPDRVHRLEVGASGVNVREREPGPVHPVQLLTSRVPHPGYPHKIAERSAFVRASDAAREAGADDALLLTAQGQVAETSIWCLFWWEGDRIAAPALDLKILLGVSRARIVEVEGPVVERRVGLEALAGRPLFLANAARGIVEVASLDGVPVPRDARTADLRARFWP